MARDIPGGCSLFVMECIWVTTVSLHHLILDLKNTYYKFIGTICNDWFHASGDYIDVVVGQHISFGVKYSSEGDC